MMNNPKILIVGYGRGGKDTMAEYLRDEYGFKFASSSMFAAEKFIYEALKVPLGYKSFEECSTDRHNWRTLWYELIRAYNWKDRSRIAKEMLVYHDIYVGMRDSGELLTCKENKVFDHIVWVDGVERTGYVEDVSSCNVTEDMAGFTITNNGTLEEFHKDIDLFMNSIGL